MCVGYVWSRLFFDLTKTVMVSSRRMHTSRSPGPYASSLSSTPACMPQVRESSRYVVAESGESGGGGEASAQVPEPPDQLWHTVRMESEGLVPARIEGVEAVASLGSITQSGRRERTGSSVLVLIPESDLTGIRSRVRTSHERMQVLTKRLLAVGPHRLPEFKAAKAVRDDLHRLCQMLKQKTGSGDPTEKETA